MDLLLWRHAEAEDGENDMKRRLTPRGEQQAEQMARWLRTALPVHTRILVSPATRAQQTAQALKLPYETERTLGPDADVPALIAASEWPASPRPVLIVGHQPTLGRLAALLLAGEEANWSIKKGALWWLSRRMRREEGQTVLRCVLPADVASAFTPPAPGDPAK